MIPYKIEKRLPFGFKGEWGKLYKLYNTDRINRENEPETIEYQQSNYVDIGQDIQLKHAEGSLRRHELSQAVTNLVDKGEYIERSTTDAYFDDVTHTYKCIVELGDIVFAEGCYWVCDKIEAHTIETPREQEFYYLGLKKIFDKIITGVQNA